MYQNQMYPQSPYMNRMFVNPTHQYEPAYYCPYHHGNQNLYNNMYVSPMSEPANYYPNNEMYANPMQATPELNSNNQMYASPMNVAVQGNPNLYVNPMNNPTQNNPRNPVRDHGKEAFVVDIENAAERNNTFRTALWTGDHLQVTLMSIGVGEDIGLEVHPDTDQFLRIEEGRGLVQMGNARNNLTFERRVSEDDAIMVPAGTWHNLTNTGNEPIKLYSIYAPPEHPFGTVHRTKADAMEEEHA